MRDPQTKTKTKKTKPPKKTKWTHHDMFWFGVRILTKKCESPVFDTMHSKENIKETSTKNLVNLRS